MTAADDTSEHKRARLGWGSSAAEGMQANLTEQEAHKMGKMDG